MRNATAFQECHFSGSKMEPPKRTGLMDYEINLRVDITSTFTQNNPPKRILLEDDQLSRSGLTLQYLLLPHKVSWTVFWVFIWLSVSSLVNG